MNPITLLPERDSFQINRHIKIGNIPMTTDNQAIKSIPLEELLGIHLDDKLKLNLNMNNI